MASLLPSRRDARLNGLPLLKSVHRLPSNGLSRNASGLNNWPPACVPSASTRKIRRSRAAGRVILSEAKNLVRDDAETLRFAQGDNGYSII